MIREVKQSSQTVVREVQKVVIGSPTQGSPRLKTGQGLITSGTHSLEKDRDMDKGVNRSNLALTNGVGVMDTIDSPSSPSPHHSTTHPTNNALIILNTDTPLTSNSNSKQHLPVSVYIPPRACSHRYATYPLRYITHPLRYTIHPFIYSHTF